MKTHIKCIYATGLTIAALYPVSAQAQMVNEPWGFAQQNRAGIASLIRSVEEGGSGSGTVSGGSGGIVNLVCGSDGQASATANNTCIILNNSEGAVVDITQDSEGDQTATSDKDITVEETYVNAEQGIDDILDTLGAN